MAIIFSLASGLMMGMILLYLKFDNPDSAFTHTLNNLRYYINCGIVVLICCAILLIKPKQKYVLLAFLLTLPINLLLQFLFHEMNYFYRAFWVIFSGILIALATNIKRFNNLSKLLTSASPKVGKLGVLLLVSLIVLHLLFH